MSEQGVSYSFDPFDAEALGEVRARQRRRARNVPLWDGPLAVDTRDLAQEWVPAIPEPVDTDDLLVLEAKLRTWADALDAGQLADVLDTWRQEREATLWAALVGGLGGTWNLTEFHEELRREELFRDAVTEARNAEPKVLSSPHDDDVRRDLARWVVLLTWADELALRVRQLRK